MYLTYVLKMCIWQKDKIVRIVNIFCQADKKGDGDKSTTSHFTGHNSDLSLNGPQLELYFREVAT
jgi:hypothetical protein